MNKSKVLICFGTRPEAIKMAPLVVALNQCDWVDLKVCVTGQHRKMLDQVLTFFDIEPDYDLDVMSNSQSLTSLSCAILQGMDSVLNDFKPDWVMVHGDTSTTLMVSLAAYYRQIPVAHVEAGLRTGNKYSPWPEEMNRRLTGGIADLHFSSTDQAKENLINEGVDPVSIHVTGNTVVDALMQTVLRLSSDSDLEHQAAAFFPMLELDKKIILVTGHRRESFGKGFENICEALAELAKRDDVQIIYPVHLNPKVRDPVNRILSDCENIFLIEPLEYLPFVWLMNKCYLILTDSGGIQEEAPSLKKPVFVMRNRTERMEAVSAGTARLIGTDKDTIISSVLSVLNSDIEYQKMTPIENPFGDGQASFRIVKYFRKYYHKV
ncbi:UDP-N-acetylglucosamine 2-epimerase (non-hydrolyzing) [Mariprofundus ferrooxydans]|nr:UDP-N-acetylglucosamine 2-epimerase (non-hydrolyzing) [Mariprofundus ferrooxydans]